MNTFWKRRGCHAYCTRLRKVARVTNPISDFTFLSTAKSGKSRIRNPFLDSLKGTLSTHSKWSTFNILRLTDLINREGRLTVVYSVGAVGRSVVKLPGPWSLHRLHRPTEVDRDVTSSGTSKAFTFFTQTIMHLVYPPKLCITIVFDFSWDDCNTQDNLKTMVKQNSEAKTRCIMVYVKVVITRDVKRTWK